MSKNKDTEVQTSVKQQLEFKHFKDLLAKAESSGGVSGSVRVNVNGVYYQFKYTILDKGVLNLRRRKAHGYDHENLRDVWMAQAFRPLLGDKLCPNVFNVYDAERNRLHAVSEYLPLCEGTLDEYLASLHNPNGQLAKELKELRGDNPARRINELKYKTCQLKIGGITDVESNTLQSILNVRKNSSFTKNLVKDLTENLGKDSILLKNIKKSIKNKKSSIDCEIKIVDGSNIQETNVNGSSVLLVGKDSNFAKSLTDELKKNPSSKFGKEFMELKTHKREKLSNGGRHCKVVLVPGKDVKASSADPSTFEAGEESDFAKSLADALAMSAIGLDHDVNPGNMVVVRDPETGTPKVARIDFGHGLGDLINVPKLFGGQLSDSDNPVFDFFNRDKVAGAKRGGDPSKLWRDYAGFVPSTTLANSLMKLGGETATLTKGIDQANREMQRLLTEINANSNDKSSKMHLAKSLAFIYKNITGKDDVQITSGKEEEAINNMLAGMKQKVLKNAENAVKAGEVMKLQAQINKTIEEDIKDFNISKLINLLKDPSVDNNNSIWFKEGKDSVPYLGNPSNYAFDKCIAKVDKELKTNSKDLSIKDTANLKIFLADMRLHLMDSSKESIVTKKQVKDIDRLTTNINKLERNIESSNSKSKLSQSSTSTFFGKNKQSSQSLKSGKLLGGYADGDELPSNQSNNKRSIGR